MKNLFSTKKANYFHRHCLITGGTQGLGRSLAIELARRGAHVTIIARRQALLDEVKAEIETNRKDARQRVLAISADVSDSKKLADAISLASSELGVPVALFCCAGYAEYRMLLDSAYESFERLMQVNYLGTVFAIKEVVRRMVSSKIAGRVVIVSSTAGIFGCVGASQYCPTKFALRGLGDALRNELQMYGIKVHMYYPPTMDTPGLQVELQGKPKITTEIEDVGGFLTADYCARSLLKGIDKEQYHITSTFTSFLIRLSMNGFTPANNVLLEFLLVPIAWWIGAILSLMMDRLVRKKGRKEGKKVE